MTVKETKEVKKRGRPPKKIKEEIKKKTQVKKKRWRPPKKTTTKKKTVVKKKQGQRWKAKPIIDVKSKSYEDKKEAVEGLEKELPEEEWKNMWAPKKITPSTLQTLKLCFSVGMTDEEACYFSKISTSTLYNFQKENSDFLEEKNILKESVTLQARVNIWRSIKKWDVADSKWWLVRRDKKFIDKQEITNKNYNYSTNLHDDEEEE